MAEPSPAIRFASMDQDPATGRIRLTWQARQGDGSWKQETATLAPGQSHPHLESGEGKMTPRERQIVELVAEARSTRQIAFRLGISAKTVEAHRTHIMKKLEIRSGSELVRYAISKGIVKV